MRRILVKASSGSYPLYVGRNLLGQIPLFLKELGLAGKGLVVTDRRVARHHLGKLRKALEAGRISQKVFYLPEGEAAKRSEEILRIYHFLLRHHFERQDVLMALGGGAVGDAAGFAASTYLRGIPLVEIGTTLLAQVDSSIGGKTGINLPEGKNLVGTFYPPRLVVSDVSLLRTLPRRELAASLAEAIKYGVIRDAGLFRYLEERLGRILAGDLESLEEVVFRSAQVKARIVERDERETRGERMILNYGHTWAHAFEASENFRGLRHGEAVALGMVCAARLARRRGVFRPEDELRQNRLIERAGLPTRIDGKRFRFQSILRPLLLDKKRKGGRLRFVFPEAIGRAKVVEDISLAEVQAVFLDLKGNK